MACKLRGKSMRSLIIILSLLAGCASQIPPLIREAPPQAPTVAEARQAPQQFVGSEVRWGGIITRVENRPEQTWVELVSRPLGRNGEPDNTNSSDGRFIASFSGFVDPLVYATGQRLTVHGTIEGETSRDIGDYRYRFPVVAVDTAHLWPDEPEPVYYEPAPPWYYDPWWPYYPWPYYHRPYPRYR